VRAGICLEKHPFLLLQSHQSDFTEVYDCTKFRGTYCSNFIAQGLVWEWNGPSTEWRHVRMKCSAYKNTVLLFHYPHIVFDQVFLYSMPE
jgi:hypothetical protein